MEEHDRERTTMDEGGLAEGADATVRQQEDAAAAEAAEIGGPTPDYDTDEASRPLYESGEGEAEGFEGAERQLRETAENFDETPSPRRSAFTPEVESDRSDAVYSEPDEEDVTEVRSDPREGPDDPGEGTDIAPDR